MPVALRQAGWWRALFGTVVGFAFGYGLVVALRAISGLPLINTEATGYPQLVVGLITGPLGFLWGIGCFDYWLRWVAGGPYEFGVPGARHAIMGNEAETSVKKPAPATVGSAGSSP